ncbi:hypothetical protein HY229_07265 [Candidatus Acetothermia bacterium]|nr:hypothetical protein [Candidatus Acetothermia bacterium]MBI3643878.1 hypothetical protein [Candidatus Acetothermia bacterium]
MKAKRPSLRGKGADIFLGEEPSASVRNVSEVVKQIRPRKEDAEIAPKEKATFYLPIEVLDELESLWHDLRRVTHRKIKKSDIVSIALQNAAEEFKAWQSKKQESCPLIERL